MFEGIEDKQDWRLDGNCARDDGSNRDPMFFLGRGGSPMRTRQIYCNSCPVRQVCFEYALVHREVGIWGGTTDAQRELLGPILRPSLERKARQEGWLEERPREPIAPQPSYLGPTEFQLPQELLDDIDLNTYLQTGS